MKRVKAFKSNQFLMEMFGIHSYNVSEPSNEFFKKPVTYFMLFCGFGLLTISSVLFVYVNSVEFAVVLQSVLIVIAGLQITGMYLSVGLNMKQVKAVHLKIQSIADQGNHLLFKINPFKSFINKD